MPNRIQNLLEAKQSFVLNLMYLPFITFFSYLQLDAEAMGILGILVMIDFFIGIAKSHVLKIPITYERGVAGILSKVCVILIPITFAFMTMVVTHIDFTTYLRWIIIALVIAESYSIMGNVLAIRTKNSRSELDLVSVIVRGIREIIEKALIGFRK